MRIEIEIPKEYEEHFKRDQFEDSLMRLNADKHELAGNYESELCLMLIKAFKNSKPAYDINKVTEQLDELTKSDACDEVYCSDCPYFARCNGDKDDNEEIYLKFDRAIKIVKAGGANDN